MLAEFQSLFGRSNQNEGRIHEGRYVKEFLLSTSLSSCGHTCTDLDIGSERKGRTEKLVKVW